MTVLEVIQRSAEFLARKGVESPRLQIELLLAHVLAIPRLKLYLDFERTLSEDQIEKVRGLVKRRGAREPLQHLIGSVSFCGYEIRVNPDVLIPRPETELLAEWGWNLLCSRSTSEPEACFKALDFGTGSGCLSIVLAAKCPSVRVWALDISHAALETARLNATTHNLANRIDFVFGNGLEGLPADCRFDLIVSNPPYIPSADIPTLQPEVRDYDPHLALDGGADGLNCFRLLASEAGPRLEVGGRLMVEFGEGQAPALTEIFASNGWRVEQIAKDYQGRERILIACLSAP